MIERSTKSAKNGLLHQHRWLFERHPSSPFQVLVLPNTFQNIDYERHSILCILVQVGCAFGSWLPSAVWLVDECGVVSWIPPFSTSPSRPQPRFKPVAEAQRKVEDTGHRRIAQFASVAVGASTLRLFDIFCREWGHTSILHNRCVDLQISNKLPFWPDLCHV